MRNLSLTRGERAVLETFTNAMGEFAFTRIESGEYKLLLEVDEGTVVVDELPLISSH